MLISVAICTWNRAKLLDQTLAGMAGLRIPEGVAWELLVVNNNCADDTDEVIARHAEYLPIRRLFEGRQGHSQARNCAIAAARGEIILWTDDDVLVHSDWLAEYVRVARSWPDASFFGGTVDPWFEVDPPSWLARDLIRYSGVYAIRQLGDDVRLLSKNESPFGANMAFRMAALAETPFDEKLGHRANQPTGGDETNVFRRLRARGHRGVWVGTARVRHFIPAERMTVGYLWRWHQGYGRAYARLTSDQDRCKMFFRAPRWAMRRYLECRLKATVLRALGAQGWLEAYTDAAILLGIIEVSRAGGLGVCATSGGRHPTETRLDGHSSYTNTNII